ncbi:MAG: tetratricopeptide repeat protein [Acidobacteria bacterium]|nr:tetratricopeptide repeat protein [Acidobacteriota bacterium]
MREEHWSQVEELFAGALQRHPDQRRSWLLARARGTPQLIPEVERLLSADDLAEGSGGDPIARLICREAREAAGPNGSAGSRLGPWVLEEVLGEGGMSTVYRARRGDRLYEQGAAVKIIRRGLCSGRMLERFHRERQILARLEHPHIARLLDGGSTPEGLPYLVMELVDGEPVDRYCDRRQLGLDQRLELFGAVCEAVAMAHRSLVVHRDLKPANILVTPDGVVKLLDFGIAKDLHSEAIAERSAPTERLLTPDFASPEQLAGDPLTTATDIYSLGVLLHLLLCGVLPIPAGARNAAGLSLPAVPPSRRLVRSRTRPCAPEPSPSVVEVARNRSLSPERLVRALKGDLDTIVLKALQMEPRERYPGAGELAEDIQRFRRGRPIQARPPTLRYLVGRFVRRHRLGVALGALAAATVLLLLVALVDQQATVVGQRDLARWHAERSERVLAFMERMFAVDPRDGAPVLEIPLVALLEQAAKKARAELAGDPLDQAAVLESVGRSFRHLGSFTSARQVLEDALDLRRSVGPEDEASSQTLNQLAIATAESGDLERAGRYFEELLELRRRLHGQVSEAVAVGLNNLALLRHEMGDLRTARRLYLESLKIHETVFGREDPEASETLANLALLLLDLGDPRAALAAAEQAKALELSRSEVRWEEVAKAQLVASRILGRDGQADAAADLAEGASAMLRRCFGEEHPEVARAFQVQGELAGIRGDLGSSVEIHRRALEMRRRFLPAGHPEIGTSLRLLGEARLAAGDSKEARILLEEATAILSAALPPNHSEVLAARTSLAGLAASGAGEASAVDVPASNQARE